MDMIENMKSFTLLSAHLLHNESEDSIAVVNHHIECLVEQCRENTFILILWKVYSVKTVLVLWW